jgi:type VI secretion system protein ImpA
MPAMSPEWSSDELLQPISAERPCGQDLEDTQLLASFDAFRLYGQTTPVDEPEAEGDDRNALATKKDPPEWPRIKEEALGALRQSKDLRLLAHLGTAALRTDGLPAFLETVKIASAWIDQYWQEVFPAIDGDGFVRRSALNNFADPMAVVDGLRKAPLFTTREHGPVTLRNLDIAAGQLKPGDKDRPLDSGQLNAAFGSVPLEELTALQQDVSDGIQALKSIDSKMRGEIGTEAAPTFDPLLAQLTKADKALRAQLAARSGAGAGDGATVGADGQPLVATGPGFTGAIRSRDEAMRALDAVAEYFRLHEPSSPVPLFCERARRLVDKPFLDVLADIAPEAVAAARVASGVRD